MRDDWSWDGPSLREETRTAQEHALELLLSVVGGSILLGLSISLFSSWLFQVLSGQQGVLFIIIGFCVVITLLIIVVFTPHIFTTIKEFHEEVEILLPLLSSSEDIKVIRVKYYDTVTELLHTALTRCSAEERKQIAQALRRLHSGSADGSRQEIVMFALKLIQFLFTTQVVRSSARLLGPQAAFHKFRGVMELQSSTVASKWDELASRVPNNHYFQNTLRGIPQKIILPGGVDLHLPDLAQEMSRKSHWQQVDNLRLEEITVLQAKVGRDTALAITALADFSEHGLPTLTAPLRGFTSRCILRNARDQHLSSLADEEELAATQLNESGQPIEAISEGELDPAIRYASVHTKLYEGTLRPYLLRIFVRFDGTFRINQFKNQEHRYGLYAWGTALAQQLAHMDIEQFMASLKNAGQKTPQRTF